MRSLTSTLKKKPRTPLDIAFAKITQERAKRGFEKEDLIIRDLRSAPEKGETVPFWFGGVRRATRKQDQNEATDFLVIVVLESNNDGSAPEEILVPVNAKSSDAGIKKLKNGHHNISRKKHHKVPIIGFIVDQFLTRRERRKSFFQIFESDKSFKEYISEKGYRLAKSKERRDDALQKRIARRKKENEIKVKKVKDEMVRKIVEGAKISLLANIREGILNSRKRLAKQLKGLIKQALSNTKRVELREAVIIGINQLERDASIIKKVDDLRDKLRVSIDTARKEALEIELSTRTNQANSLIANVFAKYFKDLWAKNPEPQFKSRRTVSVFLNSAKKCFSIWEFRKKRLGIVDPPTEETAPTENPTSTV